MDFENYIKNFTGKKYTKGELPPPGEHHFVSLCLVPMLIEAGCKKELFTYINPDGMKKSEGNLICDITYAGKGFEVKYSKNRTITFTKKQLKSLVPGGNHFCGFLAIINVEENDAKIVFISAEDFKTKHSSLLESNSKGKYCQLTIKDNEWAEIDEKTFVSKLIK